MVVKTIIPFQKKRELQYVAGKSDLAGVGPMSQDHSPASAIINFNIKVR